jgi:imidazoleglycerol phosphate synthase glutamine amidotransferase subunit HisH
MQPDVTVVDYGLGNVWSVMRAVAACGGTAELAGAPDRISGARREVLHYGRLAAPEIRTSLVQAGLCARRHAA